jgi:hypothetical protein
MYKKYIILLSVIVSCLMLLSCGKKETTSKSITKESNVNKFDVIYSGFINVEDKKVDDYVMTDYYIITDQNDWKTWSSKYTMDFPYYLEDMDWKHQCLVVYANQGAKDSYNVIRNIKNISFKDNTVDVIYDENKTEIYAFNKVGIKHISIFVIIFNDLHPSFFIAASVGDQ